MKNIEMMNWAAEGVDVEIMMRMNRDWRNVILFNPDIHAGFINAVRSVGPLGGEVFPADPLIALDVFSRVAPSDVKVVVVGQDPYPNNAANGVAFAAEKVEPSLKTIFKCMIARGLMSAMPTSGCLDAWLGQGVFLMNTAFTVGGGSSVHRFWHPFAKSILKWIELNNPNAVFILLGKHALNICKDIAPARCRYWGHPSPLNFANRNNGFNECNVFDGLGIDWNIYHAGEGSKFDIFEEDAAYIFVDGAVKGNGKAGAEAAWAYRIAGGDGSVIAEDAGRVSDAVVQTNQTAELMALLMGARAAGASAEVKKHNKVKMISDSKYALNCVFEWYVGWVENGVLDKKKHTDIIGDAYEAVDNLRRHVRLTYHHVNSHRSPPCSLNEKGSYFIWAGNDAVDRAASSIIRGNVPGMNQD